MNNMKEKYTENDEIELRLVCYAGPWFHLQWRYKKKHKFLCFNIHDSWKTLVYYDEQKWTDLSDDPRDDYYWWTPSFNLNRDADAQSFETLKKKLKTKKDLWDWYGINHRVEAYMKDLEEYKKGLKDLEEKAKKYGSNE